MGLGASIIPDSAEHCRATANAVPSGSCRLFTMKGTHRRRRQNHLGAPQNSPPWASPRQALASVIAQSSLETLWLSISALGLAKTETQPPLWSHFQTRKSKPWEVRRQLSHRAGPAESSYLASHSHRPLTSSPRSFGATQRGDGCPEPAGQSEQLAEFLPLPISKLMVLPACRSGLLNHSLPSVT